VFSTNDTELCDLEIPITEFMPEKLVDLIGGIIKAILFQRTASDGDDALQTAKDPAIRQIECGSLCLRHTLAAQGKIELAVAKSIPDLVHEIAISLNTLFRQTDITSLAG
jgi:hypothetical protein